MWIPGFAFWVSFIHWFDFSAVNEKYRQSCRQNSFGVPFRESGYHTLSSKWADPIQVAKTALFFSCSGTLNSHSRTSQMLSAIKDPTAAHVLILMHCSAKPHETYTNPSIRKSHSANQFKSGNDCKVIWNWTRNSVSEQTALILQLSSDILKWFQILILRH